jgi:hypothetical protein
MQAPKYIQRNANVEDRYKATVFHAMQFHKKLPQSHWFVNYGHPRIKLLQDRYWVQQRTGATEIFDRQWVLLTPSLGLFVVNDDDFKANYEPLSEYE